MTDSEIDELQDFMFGLPGAFEAHPWGERAAKVGKKVFAFLGREARPNGMGIKLTSSRTEVLRRAYAAPMDYGLDRSGWVNIVFTPNGLDLPSAKALILESYCEVAPHPLVAKALARPRTV